METQTFALLYAGVVIIAEMIWLITVRNRNLILVSCATILVGVQGLSFILSHGNFTMGPQYLLPYLGKLFLIDMLILLLVGLFFYAKHPFKLNDAWSLNQFRGTTNLISAFDQIFSGIRFQTKAILVFVAFATTLVISPLTLLFMVIPLFWPLLFEAIIQFPSYLYFSPIHRFLPPILVGYDVNAVISGWILYLFLSLSVIFTKRSIWFFHYLLLIFLLLNNIQGCGASLGNL